MTEQRTEHLHILLQPTEAQMLAELSRREGETRSVVVRRLLRERFGALVGTGSLPLAIAQQGGGPKL